MSLIFALILLLLALCGVVVRKTYLYIPQRELKRRAEKHDADAMQLYGAVAYGNSLRVLLWIYIALTSAGSLILFSRELPGWLAVIIVGVLLWIAFSLLPETRMTPVGLKLTLWVTPAIAGVLNYLHPLLGRGSGLVDKHYVRAAHTNIFERDDLLELIERQQWQLDSRVRDEELEIAKRALEFSDHKVVDILTPRKAVKSVQADDTIGPVLISELHDNKQNYALVRETPKGPPVGTLGVKQLGLQSSGTVRSAMDPTIYYVHEQDDLGEALHAFFVTNKPVFAVVNSFEEYVGIVTIENVLKELLGHMPGDDFDQYADPAAVAARHAKPKVLAETTKENEETDN